MAKKKKYVKRSKARRIRYSAAEKRAYWIGFGRRLEQRDLSSDYFDGLSSNREKISMNFGGDAASKYRPK